jgi:hypothetical protein
MGLKFILGIMIFVLCISLMALSFGMIASPVAYQIFEHNSSAYGYMHLELNGFHYESLLGYIGIAATPEQEMLVFALLGVLLGICSLHLFNKTAYFMAELLRVMS